MLESLPNISGRHSSLQCSFLSSWLQGAPPQFYRSVLLPTVTLEVYTPPTLQFGSTKQINFFPTHSLLIIHLYTKFIIHKVKKGNIYAKPSGDQLLQPIEVYASPVTTNHQNKQYGKLESDKIDCCGTTSAQVSKQWFTNTIFTNRRKIMSTKINLK